MSLDISFKRLLWKDLSLKINSNVSQLNRFSIGKFLLYLQYRQKKMIFKYVFWIRTHCKDVTQSVVHIKGVFLTIIIRQRETYLRVMFSKNDNNESLIKLWFFFLHCSLQEFKVLSHGIDIDAINMLRVIHAPSFI